MNKKYEYIEFLFRPNESDGYGNFIQVSPVYLEKIATSLDAQLHKLGVEPSVRLSQGTNDTIKVNGARRVDILNALQADGWELTSNYSEKTQERYLYKRAIMQGQTLEDKFSLSDVAELVGVNNETIANGYLKLGWLLIETYSSQYSEHGYSAFYCLAWSRKKGEPVYPEIKSIEDLTRKHLDDYVNKLTDK